MDSCEKFNKTALPPKKDFYSNSNLENISDEDYLRAQEVRDIMIYMLKFVYYYLQIYFKILEICLDIYELDPIYFVSAPGLAWQACLKKTKVELELLTDYDMILMTEKGIRGGICQASHRHAEANNPYMKNYNKNIESSYLEYLDLNNLYG